MGLGEQVGKLSQERFCIIKDIYVYNTQTNQWMDDPYYLPFGSQGPRWRGCFCDA